MESRSDGLLKNPFTRQEGYNCFGCSPANPIGLQLKFYLEGDMMVSTWSPDKNYQGWHGILHGGIQATLMDEIASWVVSVQGRCGGVTSRMEVRYRKAVRIDGGDIRLEARLLEIRRKIAFIEVKLFANGGELCADGILQYFCLDREKSSALLQYPGYESFLPG